MSCWSQIIVSSLSPSLTAAETGLGHYLESLGHDEPAVQCSMFTTNISISRYLTPILVTGQSPIKFTDIASSSRIISAECWYRHQTELLRLINFYTSCCISSLPADHIRPSTPPGWSRTLYRAALYHLNHLYWTENREKDTNLLGKYLVFC